MLPSESVYINCRSEELILEHGKTSKESYTKCDKHDMHSHFFPVSKFEDKVPEEYKNDTDIVNMIKSLSDLTVQIAYTRPDSNMVYGTGFIQRVRTERGLNCPVRNCENRKENHAWLVVTVTTVYHVVGTQEDAIKTEIRLSDDPSQQMYPLFTGYKLLESDKETGNFDWCAVECASHDLSLKKGLEKSIQSLESLQQKTFNKFKDQNPRLVAVVGHPRGGEKIVTFGRWVDRKVLKAIRNNQDWCHYIHNAATCVGSSGSPVFILGQPLCGYGYWFGHPHNHSARNVEDHVTYTSIGADHVV